MSARYHIGQTISIAIHFDKQKGMVLFPLFLMEYHCVPQYQYHLRGSFQQFHRIERKLFGLKNMLLDLSDNFHCLIISCKQSWSMIEWYSFRLVCVIWLRTVGKRWRSWEKTLAAWFWNICTLKDLRFNYNLQQPLHSPCINYTFSHISIDFWQQFRIYSLQNTSILESTNVTTMFLLSYLYQNFCFYY